jgi:predicted DNA-binding protein with PD1-like motif
MMRKTRSSWRPPCLFAMILGLVASATIVQAQAGARESGTPAVRRLTDGVPEGQAVPSPLTFSADFERIVITRMTFDTDVLEALKRSVAQERIKNAVILSGIGSLRSYNVHSVSNTTFPSTNVFMKGEGPYDLTAVNGYVIDGRVHAHITFSNEEKALGGHLEPGTRTFTFVIVTLGVFGDDVDLTRIDDKNWR